MSLSSPFFNRWLSQIGPDRAFEVLTDLVDAGAVFAVDEAGKILFWSRGAEKLFGIPGDKVIGQPCTEALACEGHHDPCGLAEHGVIKAESVRVKLPGARSLSCYRTARAFFDASGRFAGAIEFLQPESGTGSLPPRPGEDEGESFHGIYSRDPAMKDAIKIIRNVAETDATILIRGESGTGKELVARALHVESHRRDHPFLAINCAALTPSLLESELFGHVKGAFTGALRDHAGVFQQANGGTLFLDEVAELPLELQAKLLRVLQERSFMPVGSDKAVTVDVRIIAATHRSLREEVKAGRFRDDLMYRLRVVPVYLPPLRERRQDIGFLLWHYVGLHNRQGLRRIETIAPDAMRRLLDHAWPGNVRELQNVIEYAFAVGRGAELTLEELPPEFRETRSGAEPAAPLPVRRSRGEDEAEAIRQALQIAGGRLDEAARLAGVSRATLWRKRKKYGL
ncbi:sigma-54-dependent Fis family transcriptional regulator [Methylococcus sp. EFPC2]|uniref:sigma-54 interaction domain-containing protein n=1 Tax=Methylococcus sp. EFPC2 TaxID=2812648 RepID=UPI001968529E|nr:sigma 54-interacting transcriptional regulator [Methylococcus sp. EFPC2]QSA97229.1 sigma 54-interacting transcriptional regulator [Methylococcus sp. EFPC2]